MVFIVLIIILGIIFYPYIATAVANRKMIAKLRRIAKREAYNIIPLRRFLWIPRNFLKKYDFLIEGRGNTIAVKLFSSVKRNSCLTIRSDGTAIITAKEKKPMDIVRTGRSQKGIERILGKPIKLSEIEENWNPQTEKNIEQAILIYPRFCGLFFSDGRDSTDIDSGVTLFGKTIYTPYGLEQKMRISAKALPSGK